jgi:hypothetical protein
LYFGTAGGRSHSSPNAISGACVQQAGRQNGVFDPEIAETLSVRRI